jgi:two-component system NtrC family sensor kinase
MSDLKSSVLFVGALQGDFLKLAQRMGGELAADVPAAQSMQARNKAEVIVVTGDALKKINLQEALSDKLGASPAAQLILLAPDLAAKDFVTLTNRSRIFKVIKSGDLAQVELAIRQAFEEFALLEQHRQLVALFNQQNESLLSMSEQLEDRVKKRQAFLESAKARLISANRQLELLESALIVVYQASSTAQIEGELTRILREPLGVDRVHIIAYGKNGPEELNLAVNHVCKFPMDLEGASSGQLVIQLGTERRLSERDHDLLAQITASVSLALERLRRFQEAETLKLQWQATFDAISAPVALIDQNYQVRRANTAFAEAAGLSSDGVGGKKCYEALFSRSSPCEQCMMGTTFTLPPFDRPQSSTFIFNVTSHRITEPFAQSQADEASVPVYVNTYRDIGERHRLERQILESAKMAELGTIGGSIAHELNNPLSGIITFLQLMKMDLKGNEPFFEDIIEMEAGALRCKEIIQNLLGFSRKQDLGQPDDVELLSVIRRAIGIVDLQARSIGVEFDIQTSGLNLDIKGYTNPLTQAFVNLLQAWLDQVLGFMKTRPISRPRCSVVFKQSGARFHVEMYLQMDHSQIKDGASPATLPLPRQDIQLGLKVATQIFVEHGGVLEKFSEPTTPETNPDTSTTARPIPFARLVF